MSAALIMEPHTQEEGGDTAHARRAQNILKQKVVSDLLKDQVETEDFSEQVFLPEETSWRVQSITPDSGTDISITIPGLFSYFYYLMVCRCILLRERDLGLQGDDVQQRSQELGRD